MAFAACSIEDDPQEAVVTHAPYMQALKVSDVQPYQNDVVDAARQYMMGRRATLGLSDHTDFSLRGASESFGTKHIRLDQTHRGIKVWGAQANVHASSGTIDRVTGHLVGDLGDFDAAISFSDADAASLAKADYASKTNGSALIFKNEQLELLVYMKDKQPHLAWHVYFFTEKQAGADPGRWNYFIDATTGHTIDAFNWLTTAPLQASGPGGNPNIARTWTMELDVEPTGMPNVYIQDTTSDADIGLPDVHGIITENWMMGTNPGAAQTVTGPLDPIGDAALNDAHGFTEQVARMMYEWYGFDGIADLDPFMTGGGDEGYVVRSRVHYDFMYENAFWDGTQMTYGDGQTYFFPLTGDIDVIGHEINHGFTERHSNLIYSGESGGMNESFSDIAGTLAEFYAEGAGADWNLGTDIARPGQLPGGALRFMCDPPADGVSIDNYGDYSGQDVHYTSGISNKAFCLASSRLSDPSGNYDPTTTPTPMGTQRAGWAWYYGNAFEWVTSTGFSPGCDGIVAQATAAGYTAGEIQAIIDSWLDVGVSCAGQAAPIQCDAIWTTDTGVITSPNFPANYPNDWSFTDCIQPASGNIPTLSFTDFNTESGYDFVTVVDGSTGMVLSNTSGTTAPADATAPIIVVRFTSDFSVTRPGWRAIWGSTGGNQAPTADFTFATANLMVTFTDASSDPDGTIAAWDWNFGDGNTSTAQNPTHTYATGGTYSVSLTVTDDQGGTDTVTKSVTVVAPNVPPVASFTYAATDLNVVFTDTSTDADGSIVAWAWNFGDGNTSTAQNPTHSYAAGGTYSVSLTATDDSGDSDTAMMSITVVEPNVPPTASFTYVATDLDVAFTDTSVDADGSIVSWAWDFGDGNTSTVQNPSNSYAAAGTYTVSLTVTDDSGDSDTAIADVVVIEPNGLPTASFTWAATDLDVVFTDTSSDADGTIVSWAWDFGDGATDTVQNPSHTYAAAGSYTVTLTVTDDRGDTATASNTVDVLAANIEPTADFSFADTDLDVAFTDASADSDGSIVGWAWDFGDGGSSTMQNPAHTYAADGAYDVTLTVTDDRGASVSTTKSVTVAAEPPVEDPGGCCDANGHRDTPWAAFIVLFGLVLMRRRQRETVA